MDRTWLLLLSLLLIACLIITCQPARAANSTWSYSYICPAWDTGALALTKTGDGGYVVLAGTTFSGRSCWLLKISSYGVVEWNKTIPLYNDDWLSSITSTSDGGFALAGTKDFSSVNNNVLSLNAKGLDFWLVKADKNGNIEWNQTYGGSWHEGADAVASTSDTGFALAGYTWSFDPNGYWLVKTDDNGTLQWSHSYESNNGANELIQTTDGGFALAGTAGWQVMVLKVNENGVQEWKTNLGQSLYNGQYVNNNPRSIVETNDGGYVVLSYAFTGLYEPVCSWLCKVNSTGSQDWFQTLNGNYVSLTKVSSGGFVLAGSSNSSNCLTRTDALGNIQWIKPLGTSNSSFVRSVIETTGGFVIAGSPTDSANSSGAVWIMKTDRNGNVPQDFSAAPTVTSIPTDQTKIFVNAITFAVIAVPVAITCLIVGLLLYRRYRRTAILKQ